MSLVTSHKHVAKKRLAAFAIARNSHWVHAIQEPVVANASLVRGWMSRALAALLLIIGAPIIGFLALVVRCTSRGPAIYRQVRVGRHGRHFVMYKLRTMRADAESRTGPVWTRVGDSRITFLGRILRKLHLDEFPQLWNVVKGEMALIGPRPERPEFTQHLAREIPGYLGRLAVLPGITGLAQINLPPDIDVTSVRRKLVLDLEYIRQETLGLDLRIFFCTFVRLLGIPGDLSMLMFGLGRNVVLPHDEPAGEELFSEDMLAMASSEREKLSAESGGDRSIAQSTVS